MSLPVILQGVDTPTHHPNTPTHKPSVHRPAKPSHPKPERAHRERDGHQQRKEERNRKRRSHKSAPLQERTLPIGGGAEVRIPSLGTLPNSYRRH